jgi:replicative DNA helicase
MLVDVLKPRLDEIGGVAYIAQLAATGIPGSIWACHYAQIVRDKAIQRNVLSFSTELASKLFEQPTSWSPDWTEEVLAAAQYDLSAIGSRLERKPEPDKRETLKTVLRRIENGFENSISTGFAPLDRAFGGFNAGHLTILAARTSKGKTSLAMNFALNAARAGFHVGYFSLEQPDQEMWERALGCEAQVEMFRARRNRGYRDELEKERVIRAQQTLEMLPLEILYRPSMTPRELRIDCRCLARKLSGINFVIVDYLGLMRGDQRERERWREMQEIVFALKAIAGEVGFRLMLLSQLNRDTEEKFPPSLSNLRDTGATEEHASNVLFIWQKPAALDVSPFSEWEEVEVIIAKQRNGPAGIRVPLQFNKRQGVFAAK